MAVIFEILSLQSSFKRIKDSLKRGMYVGFSIINDSFANGWKSSRSDGRQM